MEDRSNEGRVGVVVIDLARRLDGLAADLRGDCSRLASEVLTGDTEALLVEIEREFTVGRRAVDALITAGLLLRKVKELGR